MNAFALKIIALASMLIDHVGAVFHDSLGTGFRVVGRLAFPIFAFLLAEGFRRTSNPQKFLFRLGVFALVSEPFFDLALKTDWRAAGQADFWFFVENVDFFAGTNIFYTLLLGGITICAFEYVTTRSHELAAKFSDSGPSVAPAVPARDEDWGLARLAQRLGLDFALAILAMVSALLVAEMLTTDYAAYGVIFVFLMYAVKNKKLRLAVMALMGLLQHSFIIEVVIAGYARAVPFWELMMLPATMLPALLAALYNGERGPPYKMAFYAAYPAHLAVLLAAALVAHL